MFVPYFLSCSCTMIVLIGVKWKPCFLAFNIKKILNWVLFFEIHSHEMRYIMLPSKIGWNFTEPVGGLFLTISNMSIALSLFFFFFHSDYVKKQTKKNKKTKLSCVLLLLPFAHNSLKIGISQRGRLDVQNSGGGGGHSTFFQVGVCGPDFQSVGLANWYLPLQGRGLWTENIQIGGLWTKSFQI